MHPMMAEAAQHMLLEQPHGNGSIAVHSGFIHLDPKR